MMPFFLFYNCKDSVSGHWMVNWFSYYYYYDCSYYHWIHLCCGWGRNLFSFLRNTFQIRMNKKKKIKKKEIYHRYRPIGQVSWVFANGPGDWGSILGRIISMNQKLCLIPPCLALSIMRYGSRVKWSSACNILTNKREITSDVSGVTAPTTSGGFGL